VPTYVCNLEKDDLRLCFKLVPMWLKMEYKEIIYLTSLKGWREAWEHALIPRREANLRLM
jgi:hypothetical protein